MKVARSIDVKYKSTNCPIKADSWLNSLPDLFAADFETAVRYSAAQIEEAKVLMIDKQLPRLEQVQYQTIAKASALGHPSHCTITHCSIAASENEGLVFIIDNQGIADAVLNFLIETEKTQVWHNYSYDGRFLRYYQRADAKNVEDTQVLAKTLINHVNILKARTSLKELAGAWYGDWGISSDNFTIEQQYDPKVLRYAATDACATYKLWRYLNDFIKDYKESQEGSKKV